MMGATNPLNAAPGTVRGDFALDMGQNVVHSSDGPESAEREIGLFFDPRTWSTRLRSIGRRWICGPLFPSDFRLFLASQSPRRHSLLRDIGVPYEVVATDAEEAIGGDTAVALAAANALAKVRHAALPARPP